MFNPRHAYCTFALATASLAFLPAPQAHAAVNAFIIFTDKDDFVSPTTATAPAGSTFTISIMSNDIDPAAAGLAFQLSFIAADLDMDGITVNPNTTERPGRGITQSTGASADNILSFAESLNSTNGTTASFGPGTVDLADIRFTTRDPIDRRESADIALLSVVAKDSSGNTLQTSLNSDLKVTLTPTPEPLSLATLTIPAIPLLLRRRKLRHPRM